MVAGLHARKFARQYKAELRRLTHIRSLQRQVCRLRAMSVPCGGGTLAELEMLRPGSHALIEMVWTAGLYSRSWHWRDMTESRETHHRRSRYAD